MFSWLAERNGGIPLVSHDDPPSTSLRGGYVIPGAIAPSQRPPPIEGINMPAGCERYEKGLPRPLFPMPWSCRRAPLPPLELLDCENKKINLAPFSQNGTKPHSHCLWTVDTVSVSEWCHRVHMYLGGHEVIHMHGGRSACVLLP